MVYFMDKKKTNTPKLNQRLKLTLDLAVNEPYFLLYFVSAVEFKCGCGGRKRKGSSKIGISLLRPLSIRINPSITGEK